MLSVGMSCSSFSQSSFVSYQAHSPLLLHPAHHNFCLLSDCVNCVIVWTIIGRFEIVTTLWKVATFGELIIFRMSLLSGRFLLLGSSLLFMRLLLSTFIRCPVFIYITFGDSLLLRGSLRIPSRGQAITCTFCRLWGCKKIDKLNNLNNNIKWTEITGWGLRTPLMCTFVQMWKREYLQSKILSGCLW